jgi:hypothetical protein
MVHTNKFFQKSKIRTWIFGLVSIHFFLYNFLTFEPNFYNHSDGGENLVGAYTIAKHNTYSINLEPYAGYKREPLYPFLISIPMRVINEVSPSTLENFSFDLPAFNYLKIINFVFLFLIGVIAYRFVNKKTKNDYLSLFCFCSIIYSGSFLYSAKQFLSEIPAALVILIFSIQYLDNWTEKGRKFFVLWAFGLSALIFMKAAFMYALVPIGLYWIFIYQKNKSKILLKNMMAFYLIVMTLVGLWLVRNYNLGAGFAMAGRKDEMLYNRAIYNTVRDDEYPYTYILWTPGLRKFFLNEDNKKSWERLWNWRGNDEVFMLGYEYVDGVVRKQYPVLPNGSFPKESIDIIERNAWLKIKENLYGHARITVAFLYRSLFPEDGTGLEYFGFNLPREPDFDKRVDSLFLGIISNIPYWIGFFGLLIMTIIDKKISQLGFFIFPIYLASLLSLVGFSHFRFLQPMIPILSVSLALFLNQLNNKYKRTI